MESHRRVADVDRVQLRTGRKYWETQTKVSRYGSRYWAVYLNDELLAATVYKKGALAVQNVLTGK